MIEGKGEKKMDYDPVVRERSEVKGLRGKNKTNKKKKDTLANLTDFATLIKKKEVLNFFFLLSRRRI